MQANRVVIGIVVFCLGALGTALAGPPPADAFGMLPFIDHVEISPAGTHYAAIQWDQGRPHLAVYNLRASKYSKSWLND